MRLANAASGFLLLLAPPTVAAEPSWRLAVGGVGQVASGPKPGAGLSATVLRRVGRAAALGVRVDALWHAQPAGSDEFDARQQDVLLALRLGGRAPDRASVVFELGLGITRYAGEVDIPVEPGCFGCGRYDGVSFRPAVQAGVGLEVPLGTSTYLAATARLASTPIMAASTDVHNFLPAPLSLHGELALGVRL